MLQQTIAGILRRHSNKCPATMAGEVVAALGFPSSAHATLLATLNQADAYYNQLALSDDNPGDWFDFVAARLAPVAPSVFGRPSVRSIRLDPSYQDPQLLDKAWRLPVSREYTTNFTPQQTCTSCALSTASNLMRSLPRLGRGEFNSRPAVSWHDSDEEALSSIAGWPGPEGRPITVVDMLIRHVSGKKTLVVQDVTAEEWRRHVRQFNDPRFRYAVTFSRQPLFGFGGGHHSPIGGYLEDEDLVLVLDTNKDFGPFLVESDRLLEALNTTDALLGEKRGLLQVEV